MAYEIDERESIITTDDLSDCWEIYSRQRKFINMLIKRGYEPFKVEREDDSIITAEFIIPIDKISIRSANSKGRQMTEEQKREAGERLRKGKENKSR